MRVVTVLWAAGCSSSSAQGSEGHGTMSLLLGSRRGVMQRRAAATYVPVLSLPRRRSLRCLHLTTRTPAARHRS